MRQFNLYETFGILTPGVLCVFVAWLLFSPSRETDLTMLSKSTTLVVGVGTLVCYVIGQLLQGIGDWVAEKFWRVQGGIAISWNWECEPQKDTKDGGCSPSPPKITKSRSFLLSAQKSLVEKRLLDFFHDSGFLPKTDSEQEWRSLIRQIQSLVNASGVPTQRLDAFGGCYGLCKGLTVTFGLLFLAQVIALFVLPFTFCAVLVAVALLLLLCLSVFRLYQFGIHFDRELLVSFLALPESFFSQYRKPRTALPE